MSVSEPEHVLLVDCLDRRGLVHAISGVLFRAGANVISNHEFVDADSKRFFMRTGFAGRVDPSVLVRNLAAELPANASIRLRDTNPRSLVIFVSKEHHCLADLLVRHAYKELGAQILGIVGNYDNLSSLANRFAIPFHHIPSDGLTRENHEEKLLALVGSLNPDFLVLAKYMRILSPSFVARWPNRIVNIHHSFLPAFVGARPYHQAFRRGVKVIGATSHFVSDQLDEGPIIMQQVIPMDHSYTPVDLARAGRDIERTVLANTLRLLNEDRVFLCDNRTVIFD